MRSLTPVSCAARSTSVTQAAFATLALLAVLGGRARADESGNFIVRLGSDTTSVEHYTRTPARIEVQQVGRAPRVTQRVLTWDFAGGAITRFALVATPVGAATPSQTIEATFAPDSVRLRSQSGTSPPQNLTVAIPPGTVVVTNASPWVGYESHTMQLVQSKRDSLRAPLWFVGAATVNSLVASKVGPDSVALASDRGDVFRVHVDGAGRILGVRPVAGPAQYAVQRVASLDLQAMVAAYAAREQAGQGLGVLSPRDTVRVVDVGGAGLTIDYGRPAKRGRVVFGGVVPYGQVWRTGANAATQFKTDRALDFGGTIVPAGFYTLWTVPATSGWKLIVNGETGQWGTAHKPDKDLYTIPMQVSALEQSVERFTIRVDKTARGGVLILEWDTTRAVAEFVVAP